MTRTPGKGKPLPKFASEAEERAFWENPETDMDDYFDPAEERRYEDYTSPPTRANKPSTYTEKDDPS